MRFLFDSHGSHIANEINGHLHTPSGSNIGHYLPHLSIFIDINGRYLGEIVHENRLMLNRSSPYRSTNFGVHGNAGNAGNYGHPGHAGSVGCIAGYDDIPSDRLT